MLTRTERFQEILRKLLKAKEAELVGQIVTAHSAMDYAALKFHIGKIEGIRSALEMCDDAAQDLDRQRE